MVETTVKPTATDHHLPHVEVEFRFLDLGKLAYLGQSQAVAELGVGSTTVSQAKGTAAFLLWRSVYIAAWLEYAQMKE